MASRGKVLDVNEVVKAWATEMFKISKTKEQAKIPAEDLQYRVNWKSAKIIHKEPEYQDKTRLPEPNANVLFKTTFRNNTDREQEYSFKTERCTQSSCEVEIEKGVSYGEELGLSLKLPGEVLEVGAGFHRELSVTSTTQQIFEESITWGVDSQVKVRPHHTTTAELVIKEDQFTGAFTVKTKLSGKVTVGLTNRRDNNAFVKSIEGDIVEILKREVTDNGLQGLTVGKHSVTYVTVGHCNMRFGIEQFVNLSEEAIKE